MIIGAITKYLNSAFKSSHSSSSSTKQPFGTVIADANYFSLPANIGSQVSGAMVGCGVGWGVGDGVGSGIGSGVGWSVGWGGGRGVGLGVGDGVTFTVEKGVG